MPLPILLDRNGNIATVILNKPEKMNALNLEMWRMLADTFQELSADDMVRCMRCILIGSLTWSLLARCSVGPVDQ